MYLAALAVFSGLSLNLLLSFALGISGKAAFGDTSSRPLPLLQLGLLFVSVLFLWMFFSALLPPFWRGFSVYFLFFPVSALACMGLESLAARALPKTTGGREKVFSAFTAYDGLVPASLVLTFTLAGTFAGAVILSLFFALGNLAATLVLNEIRRKSTLERLPRCLRGSPLVLISMGLLSLVSVSVAGICFRILEALR